MTAVLSPAERAVAESLLSAAWGEPVVVCAADAVWDRAHVVRLRTRDGRAAILKRARSDPEAGASGSESFGIELASLEFLAGMPVPVAPRLLGADVTAGVLVMEELPAGRSLADSLLLGDRVTALADLAAYATALGSMHAWSIGRTAGFEQARSRYSPAAPAGSWWLARIESRRSQFLRVAAELGVAVPGADAEIDEVVATLEGTRYRGFVHGDVCPDNVRLAGGRMFLFDFEFASVGSAALDAAYLLAPFPSCWCFADLPADTAAAALTHYRDALTQGGAIRTEDFDVELTAALAGWMVGRGAMLGQALDQDEPWGTTTMPPRLLFWTQRFAATAAGTGAFPRLRILAEALHDRLAARWPGTAVPAYPALAGADATLAQRPEWWVPGR